jgi:hypothetical protein
MLALDRTHDAIVILEAARHVVVKPRFEAERCITLALAWQRKGQAEYSREYHRRALAHWIDVRIPDALK